MDGTNIEEQLAEAERTEAKDRLEEKVLARYAEVPIKDLELFLEEYQDFAREVGMTGEVATFGGITKGAKAHLADRVQLVEGVISHNTDRGAITTPGEDENKNPNHERALDQAKLIAEQSAHLEEVTAKVRCGLLKENDFAFLLNAIHSRVQLAVRNLREQDINEESRRDVEAIVQNYEAIANRMEQLVYRA